MQAFFQLVATYIGLPLLEKLGDLIVDLFTSEYEKYKIRKAHTDLLKQIKTAKDPDEIRAINRKLGL